MANKEVLILLGNHPSMSGRSRQLFWHLEDQNLSTSLDSLNPLNQYPHQFIPFDLNPFQTPLSSFFYCLSNYTYYIYHTWKDTINQLPSILLLYSIKGEQVINRGENLPFKFPSLLTGLSGPFKIVAFDGVNSCA